MALFEKGKQSIPSNLLTNKFGWPPFSILNTISWDWQRRKDEWESLGIQSADGRDVKRYNATPTNVFSSRGASAKKAESISTFDPFLCELMYKWFSKEGMLILDPFAGGSVRGIVAAVLGRLYFGCDLSETQVDANWEQYNRLKEFYTDFAGSSSWYTGDSEALTFDFPFEFDMVFTCPPYYDLEKYSDDDRDLSNMPTYEDFLDKYAKILVKSAEKLKPNSFFVIVVSEIRNSSHSVAESELLGFVPDTINILKTGAGLKYYNEIILENNIGSLPIRAPKYFNQSRKIGRHHQNILVFYKGNIAEIEHKFGEVLP